jgi:hypothetical protein
MSATFWVQVALTFSVLVGGSGIVLSKDQPQIAKDAAIGLVCMAIGYWFKSPLQGNDREP